MSERRNQYPEMPSHVQYCLAVARRRVMYPRHNDVPCFGDPEIQDGYWEGRYRDTSISRISKQRFHLLIFPDSPHPEGYRTYRVPTIAQSKWYRVDDRQVHLDGFDTKKAAVASGAGDVFRGSVILEDPSLCRKLSVEFFL